MQMAERYVPFNVSALKAIAAKSVGRQGMTEFKKLAEGGFNRIFLFTLNDGFEIIAKVLYYSIVPKHWTTESEVATLDFLSSKDIPVPRVYAWSSEKENAVGSEYMVFEKAPGQSLASRWQDLGQNKIVRLVSSFVEIEKKMFSFPLGAYGSLYYRGRALPSHLEVDLYEPESRDESGDGSRFCIGPATDSSFWDGKRAQLNLDRGPCQSLLLQQVMSRPVTIDLTLPTGTDPHQYLCSVGQREREWTRKFGKPRANKFPRIFIVKGEVSLESYLDLWKKYLCLAPHILPPDRGHPLNRPTLRHPGNPHPQKLTINVKHTPH